MFRRVEIDTLFCPDSYFCICWNVTPIFSASSFWVILIDFLRFLIFDPIVASVDSIV